MRESRGEGDEQLLERERELGRIGAAIERAVEGSGELLLIEGPAGIGKTTLLEAAAREAARRGMAALAARVSEIERELPFGALTQLLEPPLRAASEAERGELLAGSAAHAAPVLGIAGQGPPAASPGFATLNGLYWLVANLADRSPVLLLLDDAHWADLDSLRFLAFLAPRLTELPALLLCAARPEEWPEPAPFAASASDPAAHPIVPAPLSEQGAAALIAARHDGPADPSFAAACHAAAAGNPFYLHALLDELSAEGIEPTAKAAAQVADLGPAVVARAIVVRLARLGAGAAGLAKALAVLGDGTSVAQAAELAGLDPSAALTAAEQLARAAILAEDAERLSFAHPITRNAIYGDIPRPERAELHRRAVELLRAAGAEPERLAAHLLALPPGSDAKLVSRLRDAAASAARRGALDSAIGFLRRALAEQPAPDLRVELLLELGGAELLTEGPAAVEHLAEALEIAEDPRLRAEAADQLARLLIFAGRSHDAVAVAEAAIARLGEGELDLRQRLQARIFSPARMEPDLASVRERMAEQLRAEGIPGDGLGARRLAGGLARVVALACTPAAEAVALAERALADGILLREENGGPDWSAAIEALAGADSELVGAAIDSGLDVARERGDVWALAANLIWRAEVRLLRGELGESIADLEQARAAVDAHGGMEVTMSWMAAFLALAQIDRGELGEAERALVAVSSEDEPPDNVHWHWFVSARCQLAIARGELRAGLEQSLDCGRRYERVGGRNPAFMPWRSRAALCLAGLGEEPERARELAAEEVALARTWSAPRALGVALRAKGLVQGGEQGLTSLREAVEVLDGSPARLEHARALIDVGAATARAGDRRAAREPLTEGIEIARACGAVPLVERGYAGLEATGASPRKIVRTGAEELTPSERRVAKLAAAGLTNREIAQQLFVTRKTIEFHLGQAFRKLEIGSRTELGKVLNGGSAA